MKNTAERKNTAPTRENNAGRYIKLLRLLDGLQQSQLAAYLDIVQASYSQLEAAKYKFNPFLAERLSKIFSISEDFITDMRPPVFATSLIIVHIDRKNSNIKDNKFLNQLHKAIRDTLPSLCKIEGFDQVHIWRPTQKNTTTPSTHAHLLLSSQSQRALLIIATSPIPTKIEIALDDAYSRIPATHHIHDAHSPYMQALLLDMSLKPHKADTDTLGKFLERAHIPVYHNLAAYYQAARQRQTSLSAIDSCSTKPHLPAHTTLIDSIINTMKRNRITTSDIEERMKYRGISS